jgi:hypothetical protein
MSSTIDLATLQAAAQSARVQHVVKRVQQELGLEGQWRFIEGGVCEAGGAVTFPFWDHFALLLMEGRQRYHRVRWTSIELGRDLDSLWVIQIDRKIKKLPSSAPKDPMRHWLKKNPNGGLVPRALSHRCDQWQRKISHIKSEPLTPEQQRRVLDDYRHTSIDMLLMGGGSRTVGGWKLTGERVFPVEGGAR